MPTDPTPEATSLPHPDAGLLERDQPKRRTNSGGRPSRRALFAAPLDAPAESVTLGRRGVNEATPTHAIYGP